MAHHDARMGLIDPGHYDSQGADIQHAMPPQKRVLELLRRSVFIITFRHPVAGAQTCIGSFRLKEHKR
jgi:hypothetical protein